MHPYIIPGIKRDQLSPQQQASLASSKAISPQQILQLVCKFYDVDIIKVVSKSRKTELVEARQVFCYLCKVFTKASLKDMGKSIGGRDHTTAIHSIAEAKNHIDTEPHYKQNIIALEGMIENRLYGGTVKSVSELVS